MEYLRYDPVTRLTGSIVQIILYESEWADEITTLYVLSVFIVGLSGQIMDLKHLRRKTKKLSVTFLGVFVENVFLHVMTIMATWCLYSAYFSASPSITDSARLY